METKLTAKDLMIGDWVLCLESTHKNKVYAQIDAIEEGQRSILLRKGNTNWFLFIDFIEPIPLTAEILEQNGFVKHRDIFYRFAVHIDEYNGFMFTLGRDFDGVFCLQSNRFVRFAYVHELQHALRLCGVDKEIVL